MDPPHVSTVVEGSGTSSMPLSNSTGSQPSSPAVPPGQAAAAGHGPGVSNKGLVESVFGTHRQRQQQEEFPLELDVPTTTTTTTSNQAEAGRETAAVTGRLQQNFTTAQATTTVVIEESSSEQQQQQQQQTPHQRWQQLGKCCRKTFSWQQRTQFFLYLLNNRFWSMLIVTCSFILLFGAQIRTLATDSRADTAFDAIFMTVFFIFIFDIIMRCDVEPNYFILDLGCIKAGGGGASVRSRGRTGSGGTTVSVAEREAPVNNRQCCSSFALGSFLFWCELASTLALLHEISFVHKRNFDEVSINIGLDSAGIPVSGLDDVNESTPIEYSEINLLVTIAKTARVARFIRSTAAMKLSSKVNWYWFWNLLNPFWYGTVLKAVCSKSGRDSLRRTGSSRSVVSNEGSQDGSGANMRNKGGQRGLVRQSSWGGLALGTVALVQAKHLREAEDEYRKQQEHGAFGFFRKCFRAMGLMRRSDESWRRNLAATKIQRAWRAAKYHNDEIHDVDHSELDYAWKARSSNISNNFLPIRSLNHASGTGGNPNSRGSRKGGMVRGYSRTVHHSFRGGTAGTDNDQKKHNESQVGSAMRELTGQRVALGIIVALVFTVLFTYTENDATRPATMVVLHQQTANPLFADRAIQAARDTSVPDLFEYYFANGTVAYYTPADGEPIQYLRDNEKLIISVLGADGNATVGYFSNRNEAEQTAVVSLLSTVFIILIWFFGVTAFVGPVMVLVVIPIERMVQLLKMLTEKPLGYQSTSRYKRFVAEEDEITKNTRWTKEILRGMETSFLMLTILRIGSLMKVGFGSAGVDIIRNNLEKSGQNTLLLSEKGITVSCIFLFCDIRQFTDATECLQEEVFVFTNRIAAVVHSICHSYGGSANKNIGDAFLLSWRLEEDDGAERGHSSRFGGKNENFVARHNQADKALLSVVKICIALHHDDYYIETMSETAREALLAKLAKRKGPVVQLGFGLHAGKAVQGAIGSQRKIDATYVSEAVERAEFLESSTKKYGTKMLMSDSFHRLLHPNNRRRCRKVDQIMIKNDEDDEDDDSGEMIELLTFDMDIDALWKNGKHPGTSSIMGKSDSGGHESDSDSERRILTKKSNNSSRQLSSSKLKARRVSVRLMGVGGSKQESSDGELSDGGVLPNTSSVPASVSNNSNADLTVDDHQHNGPPELVLPTGPALYNASVWVSEDMRRIRQLYSDGIFFQKFNSGLNSYYSRDWDHARQCFVTILERFEDGPSRYFLTLIEKQGGKPPRNFQPYGTA